MSPPFPRELLVEVANICNHSCVFCAYRLMTRPKGILDLDLYKKIIEDAYRAGSRELGLYAGAEPFSVKALDRYVGHAKKVGYEYVYITTNGSLATPERLEKVISAGLDSIKFSVNAGDRATYITVHGQDHFDKVVANIDYTLRMRDERNSSFKIFISFVESLENADSFSALSERYSDRVDGIYHVKAANVSGQNPDLPPLEFDGPCALPFNRISVTREGYLRVCCNDYQNFLAVEDLSDKSIEEIWQGERMMEIRQRHLEGNLAGTLCHNCMTGDNVVAYPVNPALCPYEQISTIPISVFLDE